MQNIFIKDVQKNCRSNLIALINPNLESVKITYKSFALLIR